MIVEGKCEFEFLRVLVRRFYAERYKGLKILYAGGDIDEQEPTLLAVHKLFSPLAGTDSPIYREKAVILIDKPNASQEGKYRQFKTGYPYLSANNQLFELPTNCLEEYYPAPHTKTLAESRQLTADGQKVPYAKMVAEAISQDEFETKMSYMYKAIEQCNTLAFH